MVLLRSVTIVLATLSLFGSAIAVPMADKLKSPSPGAGDLSKRANAAPPHFALYFDKWETLPNPKTIKGFKVAILAFLLTTGPTDMAQGFTDLTDSQRRKLLDDYHAAGISMMASAFGSTEQPTTFGADPISTAKNLAALVKKFGLDGIDVDYEDLAAVNKGDGAAERWLISFTSQLRKELPQGEYLISHAPVAPWFSPNRWGGGGYLKVNQQVGSLIDWYNVQFYNQGATEYTTCNGLLFKSSNNWPHSSLFQIAANGVPLNKLVIAKPAKSLDATNGDMPTDTLAQCVAQAHGKGWNGGVTAWEFPDATSQWIETVRGNTF